MRNPFRSFLSALSIAVAILFASHSAVAAEVEKHSASGYASVLDSLSADIFRLPSISVPELGNFAAFRHQLIEGNQRYLPSSVRLGHNESDAFEASPPGNIRCAPTAEPVDVSTK